MSASAPSTGRYRADAAAIEWRDLGDHWVMYDERHARTHLLSAETGEAVRALIDHPLDVDGLARVLFDEPTCADAGRTAESPTEAALTDDERSALGSLLEDLRRLGLVEFSAP